MADSAAPPKNMMGLAPSLTTPGFRLVDAGELYALLNGIYSNQTGIGARGTTQATGFRLTAAINTVTTASAGNTAVVLPPGLPGKEVTIVNTSAQILNVFPSGGDQLIAVGSSAQVATLTQAVGTTTVFLCVSRTLNPTVAVWKQVSVQ